MIANPERYEQARRARIFANARTRRVNELNAAIASDTQDFRDWLLNGATPGGMRRLPDFLAQSLMQWGGLTEKQLQVARRIFAENVKRGAARAAEDTARRARAPQWTAGRHTITAVLQVAKEKTQTFGRTTTTVMKGLWLLDDGRKLWCTIPGGIDAERGERATFTVTVKPADDDATMAWGSRPAVAR